MTSAEKVRATRSGDRYHYFWAALRALELLDLDARLELISVEGARDGEGPPGDEVIDLGEYYGGSDFASCSELRCVQYKHSTFRVETPITSSELETTLDKFAQIYRDAQSAGRESKLSFAFVTNRRLNANVRETLTELAAGAPISKHGTEATLLRRYMGFGEDKASEADFCSRIAFQDDSLDIDDVQRLLQEELNQYLPGGGTGAETAQLMDKIATLATSQVTSRTLNRGDVLLLLRVYEDDLFPAKPKFEAIADAIETEDIEVVAQRLHNGQDNKLLLTAVGGVGKSILTTMLKTRLDAEPDSLTILFDCFAGGDYRRVTSKRHLHRIALTQIANEIASRGLCAPLIPSPIADDRAYVRTFMRKVRQAADALLAGNPRALLTIIIDAADNAVVAAAEYGERPFVGDLFREDWPANARLVALSRPERADSINLPARVSVFPLRGFRSQETLAHLRTKFPEATTAQGVQLHALSAHNPRVQAMAMEKASSATNAIAALELAAARPGDPLDSLLADQIQTIAEHGQLPISELDHLCQALATLHPAMPISVLSEITNVSCDAIRSFAVALGRGLFLVDDTLQFRDEPTETWFRNTYQLTLAQRRNFAIAITPLADRSPYVANLLPQIYFEADMLNELIQLALSNTSLPGDANDLQSKEIGRSRTRYALGAALRTKRNADAALLAVKAGELSSGHARRMNLYRTHTDLTAMFLNQEVVESLCSGRELALTWPGSNLHVEAALMSGLSGLHEQARTRFHSSFNNMAALLRLSEREQQGLRADIDANAVADLAMVAMNLDGPKGAARFLLRWRPSEFVRQIAERLAARLADAGRADDISAVIVECPKKYVRLAAAETMYDYGIFPTELATDRLVRTILKRKKPFKPRRGAYDAVGSDVRAIVWITLHGLRHARISAEDATMILDVHLPQHLPNRIGERWHVAPVASLIVGYALRARLRGAELRVEDLVSAELAEKLAKHGLSGNSDARNFEANIPQLLPWARCLVDVILDGPGDMLAATLGSLMEGDLTTVPSYETPYVKIDGIAELATRILALFPESGLIERFIAWHSAAAGSAGRSRLAVIRIAARAPELQSLAIRAAAKGFELAQGDRTDAESRVEELIGLARAVLATSKAEARALFNAADREAELVGDDLYSRWYALTNCAKAIAGGNQAKRCYRLFQIGETINGVTDWSSQDMATPLHSLHPPSYYASVSRARDRRTLDFPRMLQPILESASTGSNASSRLALRAFDPNKSWRPIAAELDAETGPRVRDVLEAYESASRQGLAVPDAKSDRGSIYATELGEDQLDLTQLLGFDFTTQEAWNAALGKASWFSSERRKLVAFALAQRPADLPDVLRALSSATQASEADLVTAAIEATEAPVTLGTQEALQDLAQSYATRFAKEIGTRGYDGDDGLRKIALAAHVEPIDLLAMSFPELGRQAHQLTYTEYFSLASHLAHTLQGDDAGRVFDTLAQLFDDLAPPDTSSDGPFDMVAIPPSDLDTCLAGLLWTALGDIAIRRRWQAAHAVRLLVLFGDRPTLGRLAEFADGRHAPNAFTDTRFAPYTLHSRMWLLMALERCASEATAEVLEPFVPWLVGLVKGPKHAANQVLAQRTLATLVANGTVALAGNDADVLSTRLFPEVVELDWRAQKERPDVLAGRAEGIHDDSRDPFFFDFRQYWGREIADIFGSTEWSVAKVAAEIATNLTGYDMSREARDPRHAAKVFTEGGTHSDHRSWPQEEDFDFYSGIHALLTLGGELAQTESGYRDLGSDDDAYTNWLGQYLPKRGDGRWLSDRRDAPPTPAPEQRMVDQTPSKDWPWTIRPHDFEELAGHGTEWVTAFATRYTGFKEMGEDVQVSSALIPHETARAFLIAQQANPLGPHAYQFPTTDQERFDDRAAVESYRLTPWLDSSNRRDGIDRDDAQGRNVTFPPTRPGAEAVQRFALVSDADMRTWSAECNPVLRSRVWNDTVQHRGEYDEGTQGESLEVNLEFLKRMLREFDRSLVLQVGLRRNIHRPYYQRKTDDEFEWLEWSAQIFLIDSEGRWTKY